MSPLLNHGTYLAVAATLTPLRLLLIEDSEDDATLVTRALTLAGYDVRARRVDTADGLREALDGGVWDLAVADYTMPSFSGTKALAMVRDHSVDLPFIFVSGTIGEHIAVAAMKDGAHDYIMKGNLARLGPAVDRELRDVALRREHTRANERVAYLAYHDPLTDLPNRALLHERLQQAILTSRREKNNLTLLVVDLDGFKEINDALGHHAGDRVLQQVAARLLATLRESDTVARLGGDEFAMVLPITGLDGGALAARTILHDFNEPFVIDGRPLVVHGSIGIAGFPAHASTSEELLQKADAAMYLAKSDRSGFAVYAAERDQQTHQRLGMATALGLGIDRQQFIVDYQPIVDMQSGVVLSVEGLVRWNHPERGRLEPAEFIPVAERTGLITRLMSFVLARSLADWPEAPGRRPLTLSLNLSPRSLHDPTLPGRVREMLDARGRGPSTVSLEITENLIMSDPDRSTRCLQQLHDMGVRLVVDDFGTGYSSLSYLRQLPVDELKIDKSFVIAMAAGEDDALVRSIIDLAHNLRMTVVAEGVETQAVQDQLLALGCDAAQGYFIRRPAPVADIAKWIDARELERVRTGR